MDRKEGLILLAVCLLFSVVVFLLNLDRLSLSPVGTISCNDSESTMSFNVKGVIEISNVSGNYTFYDRCMTSSTGLIEYFCDNGTLKSQNYDCKSQGDYICRNGACVVATHSVCEGGTCVIKSGSGRNQCGSNFDCSEMEIYRFSEPGTGAI